MHCSPASSRFVRHWQLDRVTLGESRSIFSLIFEASAVERTAVDVAGTKPATLAAEASSRAETAMQLFIF
jgi:hypothetical protein